MDYFQRYEVKKTENQSDEYILFLFLNDQLTEFPGELGRVHTIEKTIFNTQLKVTMVKVILGGIVVTSFSLESKMTTAQASEHPSSE